MEVVFSDRNIQLLTRRPPTERHRKYSLLHWFFSEKGIFQGLGDIADSYTLRAIEDLQSFPKPQKGDSNYVFDLLYYVLHPSKFEVVVNYQEKIEAQDWWQGDPAEILYWKEGFDNRIFAHSCRESSYKAPRKVPFRFVASRQARRVRSIMYLPALMKKARGQIINRIYGITNRSAQASDGFHEGLRDIFHLDVGTKCIFDYDDQRGRELESFVNENLKFLIAVTLNNVYMGIAERNETDMVATARLSKVKPSHTISLRSDMFISEHAGRYWSGYSYDKNSRDSGGKPDNWIHQKSLQVAKQSRKSQPEIESALPLQEFQKLESTHNSQTQASGSTSKSRKKKAKKNKKPEDLTSENPTSQTTQNSVVSGTAKAEVLDELVEEEYEPQYDLPAPIGKGENSATAKPTIQDDVRSDGPSSSTAIMVEATAMTTNAEDKMIDHAVEGKHRVRNVSVKTKSMTDAEISGITHKKESLKAAKERLHSDPPVPSLESTQNIRAKARNVRANSIEMIRKRTISRVASRPTLDDLVAACKAVDSPNNADVVDTEADADPTLKDSQGSLALVIGDDTSASAEKFSTPKSEPNQELIVPIRASKVNEKAIATDTSEHMHESKQRKAAPLPESEEPFVVVTHKKKSKQKNRSKVTLSAKSDAHSPMPGSSVLKSKAGSEARHPSSYASGVDTSRPSRPYSDARSKARPQPSGSSGSSSSLPPQAKPDNRSKAHPSPSASSTAKSDTRSKARPPLPVSGSSSSRPPQVKPDTRSEARPLTSRSLSAIPYIAPLTTSFPSSSDLSPVVPVAATLSVLTPSTAALQSTDTSDVILESTMPEKAGVSTKFLNGDEAARPDLASVAEATDATKSKQLADPTMPSINANAIAAIEVEKLSTEEVVNGTTVTTEIKNDDLAAQMEKLVGQEPLRSPHKAEQVEGTCDALTELLNNMPNNERELRDHIFGRPRSDSAESRLESLATDMFSSSSSQSDGSIQNGNDDSTQNENNESIQNENEASTQTCKDASTQTGNSASSQTENNASTQTENSFDRQNRVPGPPAADMPNDNNFLKPSVCYMCANCQRVTRDSDPADPAFICLGCGPESSYRYCCRACALVDSFLHHRYCGRAPGPYPIDWNRLPDEFWEMIPAITPRATPTPELFRQMVFSMYSYKDDRLPRQLQQKWHQRFLPTKLVPYGGRYLPSGEEFQVPGDYFVFQRWEGYKATRPFVTVQFEGVKRDAFNRALNCCFYDRDQPALLEFLCRSIWFELHKPGGVIASRPQDTLKIRREFQQQFLSEFGLPLYKCQNQGPFNFEQEWKPVEDIVDSMERKLPLLRAWRRYALQKDVPDKPFDRFFAKSWPPAQDIEGNAKACVVEDVRVYLHQGWTGPLELALTQYIDSFSEGTTAMPI